MKAKGRRVVFFLPALNAGGAERAALNMADATESLSCQVVVEWAGGDLSIDPRAIDVVLVSESTERPSRLKRIQRLSRTLRQLKPDFAVSMLSPGVTTVACELNSVPVVHWLQAPWSRRTAKGDDHVTQAFSRRAFRALARRSAGILGTAPGVLDECRSMGISASKLHLLPNGLVLPPFPTRHNSRRAVAKIVTVARLEPPKRHDLLLDAIALLFPDRAVELTIVGSGPLEEALREHARRLGLADAVRFTGFVPDPVAYIASADVFALSTSYEGFGNVLVEALACGVPIVASDVPYGPRFILDAVPRTRLVKAGSPEALAAGLAATLERPPSDEDRLQARRRAEDFAVHCVAARFEEIVERILTGRAVDPPRSLGTWP
jgi:glycosyltransferase involved in cell wall biosynthesis